MRSSPAAPEEVLPIVKVLHSAPGLPEELITEVEQHKAPPGAGARFMKLTLSAVVINRRCGPRNYCDFLVCTRSGDVDVCSILSCLLS